MPPIEVCILAGAGRPWRERSAQTHNGSLAQAGEWKRNLQSAQENGNRRPFNKRFRDFNIIFYIGYFARFNLFLGNAAGFVGVSGHKSL
jgi:hypothetical protein